MKVRKNISILSNFIVVSVRKHSDQECHDYYEAKKSRSLKDGKDFNPETKLQTYLVQGFQVVEKEGVEFKVPAFVRTNIVLKKDEEYELYVSWITESGGVTLMEAINATPMNTGGSK